MGVIDIVYNIGDKGYRSCSSESPADCKIWLSCCMVGFICCTVGSWRPPIIGVNPSPIGCAVGVGVLQALNRFMDASTFAII